MTVRSVSRGVCMWSLAAAALCAAGSVSAQTLPGSKVASAPGAGVPAADMQMPDDLGAPLPGAAPEPAAPAGKAMSVNTPIAVIASSARGRAALERDLPGLCERPEFVMFRTMSPAKLAVLSGGRISGEDLRQLQADLVKIELTGEPSSHAYGLFTRSRRGVTHFSHAVYHRMVTVIASL